MKSKRVNIGEHLLPAGFIMLMVMIITAFVSSCGKASSNSPTGLNTQLNIINASPDVYPIDLFINQRKQNTKSYIYGVPSGYFYLSSLDVPLQIRTTLSPVTTIFEKDTALSVNVKYSIFITGLVSANTRTSIFVVDSDAAATAGRGKIRFINAAARSVNVDIYANGTPAFKNQGFKAVSKYIELPAGVYDLKIYAANTTTVLADLTNTTIQDGKLYTLYSRGIVGSADSAAFTAGIIINR